MTYYQTARVNGTFNEGIVLDEFVILRRLKDLSEQTKRELLSYFLDTRTTRYLVLFPSGDLRLFRPDDVVTEWHDAEVA